MRLALWITTHFTRLPDKDAVTYGFSHSRIGRFFLRMPNSSPARRFKNLLFSVLGLKTRFIIFSDIISLLNGTGSNIFPGAFLAFSKPSIGHSQVNVKLRSLLLYATLKAPFHSILTRLQTEQRSRRSATALAR